jgi:hypothetical protein
MSNEENKMKMIYYTFIFGMLVAVAVLIHIAI